MKTRVCIVQPLIPRYRVPVFEALSQQPSLDVEIWADLSGGVGSLSGITSSNSLKLRHAAYKESFGIVWQPKILSVVNEGFDVVILSWNVRSPHLHMALLKKKRSPILLWGHGFGSHQARIGDWLRLRTAHQADGCIFYGPTGMEKFIEKGVSPDKLFIALNALDQTNIQQARNRWLDETKRKVYLARFGIGDGPIMLYLSRLEASKKPELAIEALALMLNDIPATRLIFIGDGSARKVIEAKADELGVRYAVRFLGTINDEDEIAPWALSASLLINPGALGLSIFHAFGYGLPVITTNKISIHGPEVEALKSDINGLFYKHDDLLDIVKKCKLILLQSTLKERLGNQARQTVLQANGRNIEGLVCGMQNAILKISNGMQNQIVK